MPVTDQIKGVKAFLKLFAGRLSVRRDNGPIDSIAEVERFVATRAALISQKKLYGYVKTRMGTQYPKMFEDDAIIASVDIAKYHVFAASLSDLTIFAIAHLFKDREVADADRRAAAGACYKAALAANADGMPEDFDPRQAAAQFAERLDGTLWQSGALTAENFTASPKALVRWAPIAPELKQYDTEIVENSIKYAWREIRAHYLKRLDANAVLADWSAGTAEDRDRK